MTAAELTLPHQARAQQGQQGQLRKALGKLGQNTYPRLLAALFALSVGATVLALGVVLLLDLTIPLIFDAELRALSSLFPQK